MKPTFTEIIVFGSLIYFKRARKAISPSKQIGLPFWVISFYFLNYKRGSEQIGETLINEHDRDYAGVQLVKHG